MTNIKTAIAIAVGTLFAGAAFAQSNYEIEQRDRNEQARIDRGVQTGQLTSREADRLQGERAQIERMERRARADGVMTQHERARIDGAQDRLGRDIYRESHDRQTSNGGGRGSDGRYGWNNGNEHRGNGFGRGDEHRGNAFGRGNEQRGNAFGHGNEQRGNAWGRGNEQHGFDQRNAPHAAVEGNHGRSDSAPGRQPHLQQNDAQRTHVQQAQTQRTWTRPAQTGNTQVAAVSPTARAAGTGGNSRRTR